MKKILYLTNIEAPYRVRFLNELSHNCDLTVLYEREQSSNRNDYWAKSVEGDYRIRYLNGIKIGGENCFSFGIFKEIFSDYDHIVVGCYNSPIQALAIVVMRLFRISYILNLDGNPFAEGNGFKVKLKRFFLRGADKYLMAGEKATCSLKRIVGEREIITYHFSSLFEHEIQRNHLLAQTRRRNETILVVGQYFDYKGMDVALEAARMDKTLHYKFVGMGTRTEQFMRKHPIPENVEIIPFLQKQELEREYQCCAMLVLPSRKECWGLVITEAASFGMPIVSTWGSGAAMEYLSDGYPQYLAKPGDAKDLLRCIRVLQASNDKDAYAAFLMDRSKNYHIEQNVQAHLAAFR